MRILGYCLMPNHFHLVLRPRGDGDLGAAKGDMLEPHEESLKVLEGKELNSLTVWPV